MFGFSPLLIGAVIVLSICEYVLMLLWVPFYYRFGIPMYRVRFKLLEPPADMAAAIPELEKALPRNLWNRAVVFKSLGLHELAFRNQMGSRNAPVHGRVNFDPYTYELVVTGYFYWTLLLLPLMFIGFFATFRFFLPMVAFVVLAIGLNVLMLRSSYGRVGQAVKDNFNVEQEPYL